MNDSAFEKVSRRNGQLNIPSKRPDSREMIMRKYSDHGYIAIEKWFRKKYKKQIMDNKYIGILTSGGDASGMNAAIRAVTRAAIF